MLALVGPSGGGKTTLCNLIPRFYTIDDGDIKIDGKSIYDVKLESLRKEYWNSTTRCIFVYRNYKRKYFGRK